MYFLGLEKKAGKDNYSKAKVIRVPKGLGLRAGSSPKGTPLDHITTLVNVLQHSQEKFCKQGTHPHLIPA